MRSVVKICGLRRLADAELSMVLGADYLGCVVARDSPRRATIDEVSRIAEAARGRATVVLVFRESTVEEILRACDATSVRRVQIHGTNPVACRMLRFDGITVHPVFRVRAGATRLPRLDPAPTPNFPAILDGGSGGAGETFSWDLLEMGCPKFTFIAGGITPDNVTELLAYRPFGIDVSSGLEAAHGIKDPSKMRCLFDRLRQNQDEDGARRHREVRS
jgi:phosphoribosylanthranilate isomerase